MKVYVVTHCDGTTNTVPCIFRTRSDARRYFYYRSALDIYDSNPSLYQNALPVGVDKNDDRFTQYVYMIVRANQGHQMMNTDIIGDNKVVIHGNGGDDIYQIFELEV